MNKVYLDNSGSTKVLDEVRDTFNVVVDNYYANCSAVHNLGNENSLLFKEARKQVASLCAVREDEIFFTSGATESINTAIKGSVLYNMHRKNHVVTTTLEHSSVISTLKYLEKRFNIEVTYVKPENGKITAKMITDSVKENTVLVTMVHVQSETGNILPINEVAEYLKNKETLLHIDACQSFGKFPINLNEFDMVSVSFHKLHGIKGSGMLFKKHSVLIDSLIHGGNQQEYRSGTIPLELCVCGAKCVRIAFENMNDNYSKVEKNYKSLYEYFDGKSDVFINSAEDGSPYILNISILNIHIAAFSRIMWEKGFYFSTKTSCSSGASYSEVIYDLTDDKALATNSIRISIGKYNTVEEIQTFIQVFDECLEKVRGNNCG